nr:universal stress protein [uncultured Allomuricauda sp.]
MDSKILVPYDFSSEARHALKLGREVAAVLGYRLKVLHCLDFPQYPYLDFDSVRPLEKTLIDAATKTLVDDLDRMFGSLQDLEIDIVSGSASSNILDATFDHDVNYTFMGYKDREIPEHLGSTTRDILRFANGSVMSLKKEVSLDSINHILLVTDFQNTSVRAMENLKLIKKITKAEMTLLYVNTRENWLSTKETKRAMKQFCEIHDIQQAKLEIINDSNVVSGTLNGLLNNPYDLVALKLNALSDEKRFNDLHLMGEMLLENTNTPILTYVHNHSY